MPRRMYRTALLAMLLAAPAALPAAACDGDAWVESTLYMGRGLDDVCAARSQPAVSDLARPQMYWAKLAGCSALNRR